jgi:hypothetical protein
MKPARVHEVKGHPDPFEAVFDGRKPYEIRVNDRDYRVGDVLYLREWDPESSCLRADHGPSCSCHYSGRYLWLAITYLTRGGEWGLPLNLCVLGITRARGFELCRRCNLDWADLDAVQDCFCGKARPELVPGPRHPTRLEANHA